MCSLILNDIIIFTIVTGSTISSLKKIHMANKKKGTLYDTFNPILAGVTFWEHFGIILCDYENKSLSPLLITVVVL